jgi:23S rRNA pseudouridine2605 synthase
MKERIQKVLANAGVASRRNIEEMVLQGRVSVNGKVVHQLPVLIDPAADRVTVDDEPVRLGSRGVSERVYLVMNKPRGVYTTNVAQGAQTRAVDLLPPNFATRVYPVGRLDAESKGLLLLTNDGEMTNRLTHPRYGVPKTYRAVVDGYVTPQLVGELEKGVWLGDREGRGFKTGRSQIKIARRSHDKSVLEITVREGRTHQVRQMLAQLGHKVRDLTRIRMGPLTLEGLAPGTFRPLTPRELRELRQVGQPKSARPQPALRERRPSRQ